MAMVHVNPVSTAVDIQALSRNAGTIAPQVSCGNSAVKAAAPAIWKMKIRLSHPASNHTEDVTAFLRATSIAVTGNMTIIPKAPQKMRKASRRS